MAIAHPSVSEQHESDPHGHDAPADPNVAPTHSNVKNDFTYAQVAVAWVLGAIAVVGGIVLGLTVVNN